MRDLMLFQQKTIQTLCGILTNLITGGKRASDQLLWKIGEVLDLLLLLDEIKNAKACLSNDLSFYKRYVTSYVCIFSNYIRTAPWASKRASRADPAHSPPAAVTKNKS
jgi:hypothetical protein